MRAGASVVLAEGSSDYGLWITRHVLAVDEQGGDAEAKVTSTDILLPFANEEGKLN